VIDFANLDLGRADARAVENLFPLLPHPAFAAPEGAQARLAAYRRLQGVVRTWLERIADVGAAARAQVAREAEAMLVSPGRLRGEPRPHEPRPHRRWAVDLDLARAGPGVTVTPSWHPRRARLVYQVKVGSVAAAAAFGVLLMLDRSRGLTTRVGRCAWCGRFFATWRGRPRVYCRREHYVAHDRASARARVAAWRARQRQRRRGSR
jgi:hypothetical protein